MRLLGPVLLASLLLGCAHNVTTVQRQNGVDLGRYHRIGILPFTDYRGKGQSITQGLEDSLRGLHFTIADDKVLDQILSKNRLDPFYGMNLETLSEIRARTGADVIIFGGVARDWHQATLALFDTEQGDTVLRATLRPGRGKKVFATQDEIIAEALHVLVTPGGE